MANTRLRLNKNKNRTKSLLDVRTIVFSFVRGYPNTRHWVGHESATSPLAKSGDRRFVTARRAALLTTSINNVAGDLSDSGSDRLQQSILRLLSCRFAHRLHNMAARLPPRRVLSTCSEPQQGGDAGQRNVKRRLAPPRRRR